MGLSSRQYQYDIIPVELDLILTDVSAGLTKKINTLTVITLNGGSLSVRLNADTNDLITLSDGFKIEGIPISQLYWKTTALQAGLTAEIFTAWVD